MAYGIELVLGFPRSRWKETPYGEVDPEEAYQNGHPFGEQEPPSLHEAHLKALADAGFTPTQIKDRAFGHSTGYSAFETPMGVREFSPFSVELIYDPNDEDDAVIGVAISGRYFPRFVDWHSEYGTINNVDLDSPDLKRLVRIARQRITEVLPWMATASLMVVQKHY